MDTKRILAELRAEHSRIAQAIAALEALDSSPAPASRAEAATPTAPKHVGGRKLTAAGRRRIAEAAKARWARHRQNLAKTAKPAASAKKSAPARRVMSTAVRKRLSELAKKRWAERKKGTKGAA